MVFACSFVLAVIFSRGFYLKVLRGHIGNLTFWFKNINYRFAHQVKGNFKDYKTDDFVFRLYNQFLKLPPIVITVTNPWTLPVLYIFIFSFPADFLLGKLIWWVIFSYILVLLTTWVPFLKFLGEPQRYLELSVFPAAFLSALFLANSIKTDYYSYLIIFYLIVSVAAFITIIVIQRKAIIKDKLRTVTPKMEEMFVYLKSLKVKPKLLCIPHQITTNTIYHTGCSVFVNADYTNIDKISDVYPFLRIPIEKIMKKYNLDAVLLNEDYATIADLKLEKFMIIKQTGNFVLLSSSFS